MTKTLLDLGVLQREDGGYRSSKAWPKSASLTPSRTSSWRGLDRLGDEGKRTVQLASVIGQQFLRRLLERIAGLTGQLEGILRELKALEIIYEQGLYTDRLAEHFEELAHHFTQGEAWQKAMEYSVLAGRRAGDAFANTEAKAHYTRALEAAERIVSRPAPSVLADLHVSCGAVLAVLGQYDEAVAEYQRALDLVRKAGDRRREVEALLGLSNGGGLG